MITPYTPVALTKVAIVGRPNVGKSTLFNRLAAGAAPEKDGKRPRVLKALSHPTAGTTRDVRQTPAALFGLRFMLLDTAGVELSKRGAMKEGVHGTDLQESLNELALGAAERADVLLFILDGAVGITPADRALAQTLRKMNKPIVVLINKADLKTASGHAHEVETLGFGVPILVSAAHNGGLDDLCTAISPHITVVEEDKHTPEPEQSVLLEPAPPHAIDENVTDDIADDDTSPPVIAVPQGPAKLAILGRPNVGKSTLVNALLGQDAMLTGPIAGLTREAIAHSFTYHGQAYELVDTPGLRRKSKVDKEGIEFLSVGQSLQAAEAADIVVLVIDASTHDISTGNWQIFEQQDAQISALALRQHKPIIVALNKWDSVKEKEECMADITIQLRHRLHGIHQPIAVPLSALKKKGLEGLLQAVADVQAARIATFSTNKLNNLLSRTLAKRSPPLANGKVVSLKFVRQTGTNPPTFTFWGNRIDQVSDHYKQFLRNQLAEVLGLSHIPVRLFFKANANPFSGRKFGSKPEKSS